MSVAPKEKNFKQMTSKEFINYLNLSVRILQSKDKILEFLEDVEIKILAENLEWLVFKKMISQEDLHKLQQNNYLGNPGKFRLNHPSLIEKFDKLQTQKSCISFRITAKELRNLSGANSDIMDQLPRKKAPL